MTDSMAMRLGNLRKLTFFFGGVDEMKVEIAVQHDAGTETCEPMLSALL